MAVRKTARTLLGLRLFRVGQKKKSATLNDRDDPKQVITLTYSRPDPNTLVLDGLAQGRTFHATCHLGGAKDLLLPRGFHWVNEYPFNR